MAETTLIKKNGNTSDAIFQAIKIAIQAAKIDPTINQAASDLKQARPREIVDSLIYEVSTWIMETCPYKPNPDFKQLLQRPEVMIRNGHGNCMDYSIFYGALCLKLNIPVYLKAVSLKEGKPVHHIYPIVNGFPVDLVLLQENKFAVLGQEPPDIKMFEIWKFIR